MNDPLRHLRRRIVLATIFAVLILSALGWWAFQPTPEVGPMVFEPLFRDNLRETSTDSTQPARNDLDLTAFDVELWRVPVVESPPQPEPPPETPRDDRRLAEALRKIELIGIISPPGNSTQSSNAPVQLNSKDTSGGEHQAAVFDAVENRLAILSAGDTVRELTVAEVSPSGVTFSLGSASAALELKQSSVVRAKDSESERVATRSEGAP